MEWPWRPPRLLVKTASQYFKDDLELENALFHPLAGAERWQENKAPRQLVLAYEREIPAPLKSQSTLKKLQDSLSKIRTGRWQVTVCALDEQDVSLFRRLPLQNSKVLTPLGELTLFPSELFVDLYGPIGDLRLAWARHVAAVRDAYEYNLEWSSDQWIWVTDGIFPLRLIERWPEPAWIDCALLSPHLVPLFRKPFTREDIVILDEDSTQTIDGALGQLEAILKETLGMPCQLRPVNFLPGAIEDTTGKLLGKDPQLEVLEELKSRAARCENAIEQKFFWEALKDKLHLTPQYEIGRYRVDFALERAKVAVEIDGQEYHSSPEQRERDYERENFLKGQGWEIVRFTAGQVNSDAGGCVRTLLMILMNRQT